MNTATFAMASATRSRTKPSARRSGSPVPAASRAPRDAVDPRLVKLTREVLEGLKHPQAVPSQVIMAALVKAAALSAK